MSGTPIELTPFTKDLGNSQGVLVIDGVNTLVLGSNLNSYEVPVSVGDSITYTTTFTVTNEYLTIPCLVKPPAVQLLTSALSSVNLTDGDTLTLKFENLVSGEVVSETITFSASDFNNIASARDYEIEQVINSQVTEGFCSVDFSGLSIRGFGGIVVSVEGGSASSKLLFKRNVWEVNLTVGGVLRSTLEVDSDKDRMFVLGANTIGIKGTTVELGIQLILRGAQ